MRLVDTGDGWFKVVLDAPTDEPLLVANRDDVYLVTDSVASVTDLMRGTITGPKAPTTASNPGACTGVQAVAQSEPPKLYCPAHGHIVQEPWNKLIFDPNGKPFCPKCVANLLDRSGVHQLVEKMPEVKKGW